MAGYETDFVSWTREQATTLRDAARAGSNLRVDWMNVAEEIESLGNRDRRELRHRMTTLLEHLLKLAVFQEIEPRRGWSITVRRERRAIARLLDESPSLRGVLDRILSEVEADTRDDLVELGADPNGVDAALAAGLAGRLLDSSYVPEGPHHD